MNDSIRTAIVSAHASDMARDVIIIGLVSDHGLTLNAATKAYATVAKSEGWTAVTVSYKEDALDWLSSTYGDDWDVQAVKDSVVELVARYGIADSTARDYCKAYSQQLGVAHPSEDPRALMFAWMKANIDMPRDEFRAGFKAYAKDELGRSASNINEYLKASEFYFYVTE